MSNANAAMTTHQGFFSASFAESDPDLNQAITGELCRQQDQIELIASENIVSRAVLEATGSVLTNKYAEGYPERRYYGGCEYVDIAEELAIARHNLHMRFCERPTAFRGAGKRGSLFCFAAARGHDLGFIPISRRTPVPRSGAKSIGKMV